MEHLDKTMSEYVFQEGIPSNTDSQFADKVMAYANFLSETLNPSMFVPSVFEDGKWVILSDTKDSTLQYHKRNEQFQSALENVYFEGFEYLSSVSSVRNLDAQCLVYISIMEQLTIENLLNVSNGKLKLTPTIQNRLK